MNSTGNVGTNSRNWSTTDWLISVDDHLVEPPDIFAERLPRKYREQAPLSVHVDNQDAWRIGDRLVRVSGLASAAGLSPEEFNADGKAYAEMRPGCYDVKARISDMDKDHVAVQCCFPGFPGAAGAEFALIRDRELARAVVSAYNDWLLEELEGGSLGRLIGYMLLPVWDREGSVREIERVAACGAVAVSIPNDPMFLPGCKPYSDRSWDSLWNALEDTGLYAALHIVSAGVHTFHPRTFRVPAQIPDDAVVALAPLTNALPLADIIFGGVLSRHPRLRLLSAESGVGWLSYFLERADQTFTRHRHWTHTALAEPPSAIVARSLWASFISDTLAEGATFPLSQCVFGSDYPHPDGSWPESRMALARTSEHLMPEDAAKLRWRNAERLIGKQLMTVG